MIPSSFNWRGTPSQIGKTLIKTQTAPKTPAPPITFAKDRRASINTEKPRAKPVYSAE